MEITRISLSPFDFGRAIGNDHATVCSELALNSVTDHHWHSRLIGEMPALYSSASDHTLFIFQDGFGLNLRRSTLSLSDLGDHEALARALIARAQYHRSFRDGAHSDIETMIQVRDRLADCNKKFPVRPLLWPKPPYTLSFYYVNEGLEEAVRGEDARKGLYALLEPSQVMVSELLDKGEDAVESCANLVGRLRPEKILGRYKDCDIRAGSALYCSWAGVVMFDPHCDSLPYLESLEIRLQNAWLRANFTRRYAESLLTRGRLRIDELNQVSASTRPLLRQSQRLIDATASSRDQEIFDELISSSDLDREIQAAEDALEDVQSYIAVLNAKRIRRYDMTVQSTLFLLALLQVYPLFYQTPLVRLPGHYEFVPAAVFLFLAGILAWSRRKG